MRLITNLSYACLYDEAGKLLTRMHTNAVLLMHDNSPHDIGSMPPDKIRGFTTSGSTPSFDMWVTCDHLDYETLDWQGNAILLRDDGSTVPIGMGVMLRFADGTRLRLDVDDYEQPIDFLDLPDAYDAAGTYVEGVYDNLWALLPAKVAQHWRAPNMPIAQFVRAADVRAATEHLIPVT